MAAEAASGGGGEKGHLGSKSRLTIDEGLLLPINLTCSAFLRCPSLPDGEERTGQPDPELEAPEVVPRPPPLLVQLRLNEERERERERERADEEPPDGRTEGRERERR